MVDGCSLFVVHCSLFVVGCWLFVLRSKILDWAGFDCDALAVSTRFWPNLPLRGVTSYPQTLLPSHPLTLLRLPRIPLSELRVLRDNVARRP